MSRRARMTDGLVIDSKGRLRRVGQKPVNKGGCECKIHYGATQCPHVGEDEVDAKKK